MEVADGVDDVDGLGAEVIGGSDDAGLHSASGHEHGHGVGIMAAADGVDAAALVIVRGAAEFAGPDHEGVIEHAALLEIADECSDGFVDGFDT